MAAHRVLRFSLKHTNAESFKVPATMGVLPSIDRWTTLHLERAASETTREQQSELSAID